MIKITHRLLASAIAATLVLASGTAIAAADTAAPYHLVNTTAIGGSPHWQTLEFDKPSNRVFFSNGKEVSVIDAATGKVIGRVMGIGDAHGLVLRDDTNRGYVANGDRGTVSEFDMHSYKVLREIPADGGTDELAFDPTSGHLFSMNGGSHDISVIDLARHESIATIALGGQPEMAAADGEGHVFVNVKSTSELARIDTATNTIGQRVSIAACDSPHGLGYHPGVRRLFVSCGGGVMLVLDPADLHTVAQLAIGTESDTVQVDAARNLVFSANATGTLSIVKVDGPDTFTVTEMPTAIGARIMTFSSLSGRLFIPTAELKETIPNPANAKLPRFRFQPDTVRLMIYDPVTAQ